MFIKERGRCSSEKWCKHYEGINHTDESKRCAAGVLMSDVMVARSYKYRYAGDGGTPYTASHSYPCFTDGDPLGVCHCEKREFKTQEEKDAAYAEIMGVFNRTVAVRAAIVAATNGERPAKGQVACPACEVGTVSYEVAKLNGHIHAACSTTGCVRWME